MNITPNIFWNMLRMEKALQQLQESDERLTEIAIDLGFSTQGNFSRFFREHIGVPPAVYRSAMRISEAADT
jgi:AraC-like DNA-binding protein